MMIQKINEEETKNSLSYWMAYAMIVVCIATSVGSFQLFFLQSCYAWQGIPAFIFFLSLFLLQIFVDPLKTHRFKFLFYAVIAFFITILNLYIMCRFCKMLNQPAIFGDETEKFSGAYLISEGQRIYDDFICIHGPVTFMFTHLWYVICHSTNEAVLRIIGLFIYLIPVIVFIRKFRNFFYSSLLTTFGYLGTIAVVWEFWGQNLSQELVLGGVLLYQSWGGVFLGLSIICMLSYLLEGITNKTKCFFCGFLLVFSFFTAISLAFSCVCIVFLVVFKWLLDENKKKHFPILMWNIYGGIVAFTIIIVWLLCFGSIIGYCEYCIYFCLRFYTDVAGTCNWSYPFRILVDSLNYPAKSMHIWVATAMIAVVTSYIGISKAKCRKDVFFNLIAAIFLFIIILYSSMRYMLWLFHGSTAAMFSIVLLFALWRKLPSKKMMITYGIWFLWIVWIIYSNGFNLIYSPIKTVTPEPIILDLTKKTDCILYHGWSYHHCQRRAVFDFILLTHHRPYFDHEKWQKRPEIIETLEKQESPLVCYPMIIDVYKKTCDFIPEKQKRVCNALEKNYYGIKGTPWAISRKRYEEKKFFMKQHGYEIFTLRFLRVWGTPVQSFHAAPELCISSVQKYTINVPFSLAGQQIKDITFKFATYCRKPEERNGILTVQFLDDNQKIISTFSRNCTEFKDNTDVSFHFTSHIITKYVRFSSTSTPGHGITMWMTEKNQPYMKIHYTESN